MLGISYIQVEGRPLVDDRLRVNSEIESTVASSMLARNGNDLR